MGCNILIHFNPYPFYFNLKNEFDVANFLTRKDSGCRQIRCSLSRTKLGRVK